MSSGDKKVWKEPEIHAFANAEEAIEYYSSHGCAERVAAIKRLVAEAHQERLDAEHELERSRRLRSRRAAGR